MLIVQLKKYINNNQMINNNTNSNQNLILHMIVHYNFQIINQNKLNNKQTNLKLENLIFKKFQRTVIIYHVAEV